MSWHKRPVRWAMRHLPPWRGLDRAFALAMYLHDYRRLPRRPVRRFEDLLYFLKTRELEDRLRLRITDKLEAKAHIRETLGRDACPETLAVFRRPEEVTAAAIPVPCIVKPTHMSGRTHLALAPPSPAEIARIRGWLGESYYRLSRERNYLALRPGIVCEALVAEPGRVVDHKVFCLGGRAMATLVVHGRAEGYAVEAYDRAWRRVFHTGAVDGPGLPAPAALPELYATAERLAAPFSFIRVDCYIAGGRILVGELTNLPTGGRIVTRRDYPDAMTALLFPEAARPGDTRPGARLGRARG